MSKGAAFETSVLALVLQNVAVAGVGDAGGLLGSADPGALYVSLHTQDPGESGLQSSHEAGFTGYTRASVARLPSLWTVAGGRAENASAIAFPECTGNEQTVTHFGIGIAATGGGQLLYRGALGTPELIQAGMFPRFAAGAIAVTEA